MEWVDPSASVLCPLAPCPGDKTTDSCWPLPAVYGNGRYL